jgi:hypothetical protein
LHGQCDELQIGEMSRVNPQMGCSGFVAPSHCNGTKYLPDSANQAMHAYLTTLKLRTEFDDVNILVRQSFTGVAQSGGDMECT